MLFGSFFLLMFTWGKKCNVKMGLERIHISSNCPFSRFFALLYLKALRVSEKHVILPPLFTPSSVLLNY